MDVEGRSNNYTVTQTELPSDSSQQHRLQLPTNSKRLELFVRLTLHKNISLICVVHPKGAPHTLISEYVICQFIFYLSKGEHSPQIQIT